MITIVDYGLGNIGAFANTYKRLNIPTKIATRAEDIATAQHIILPGVGSFDHAMTLLDESGMRHSLDAAARGGDQRILGVCVGMQMLAEASEEGVAPGLGWIRGRVRAFASNAASAALPMPHMGWNDVSAAVPSVLFRGLETDARFYFLHSFYFDAADPETELARASYGFEFACAVRCGNIFGVQFHPEKSHHWGTQLLKNFSEI